MGFLLAILTSFSFTAQNTAIKKSSINSISILISWATAAVGFVVIVPVFVGMVFWQGMPGFEKDFWLALLCKVPLMVVASLFYVKAHKHGEMSIISPLLAFTPAIIAIIAPFTINQTVNFWGGLGIALIIVGSYVLNFSARKEGLLRPIEKIFQDKGSRYILMTATIWGITTVMDVWGLRGVDGSNFQAGLSWALATQAGIMLAMTAWAFKEIKKLSNKEDRKDIVLAGFFNGVTSIFQMTASAMIFVVYVNAIKRFSMVLGVMVGAFVFKEEDFHQRLAGSAVMFAGVILIITSAV